MLKAKKNLMYLLAMGIIFIAGIRVTWAQPNDGTTLVFYALDAMYGKTIDDAVENTIDNGGLSGASINVLLNESVLTFVDNGNGTYTFAEGGQVQDLTTGSDGKLEVYGLDEAKGNYEIKLIPQNTPFGYFVPTDLNVALQKTNQRAWHAVYSYHARELILHAQTSDGAPLNGVKVNVYYPGVVGAPLMNFVQISDGIYRQAQEGESGTNYMVTANVEGSDGVALLHGVDWTKPLHAGVRIPNEEYYAGQQFPKDWRQHREILPADQNSRRASFGTATFYKNIVESEIPLPSMLDGYGKWELNKDISDEFNGEVLDQSKWQSYHKANIENSSVKDGYLNAVFTQDSEGGEIKAGGVWSRNTDALYGYFECRMKGGYMPGSYNFWLMSQKEHHANVEIDIAENRGASKFEPSGDGDRLNNTSGHYPNLINEMGRYTSRNSMSRSSLIPNGKTVSDDFITYSALWEPGKVTFYADGEVQYVIDRDYAYPMGVVIDMYAYFGLNDYAISEYSDTHNGVPINTMLVDYVRCWTRTDITYTPQEEQERADDYVQTLPKEPQNNVGRNWNLDEKLSDEFNDNSLDTSFWTLNYGGEYESHETLRIPRDVFDPYSGANPLFETGLPKADEYLKKNRRNEWVQNGVITTNKETGTPYGYGYYEFRVKASQNLSDNEIKLNAADGSYIRLHLYAQAKPNTEWGWLANNIHFSIYNSTTDKSTAKWDTPYEDPSIKVDEEFHVIGVLHQENGTEFYINGRRIWTTDIHIPQKMNLELRTTELAYKRGSNTYEELVDGRDNNFYIDYVRYYTAIDSEPIDPSINPVVVSGSPMVITSTTATVSANTFSGIEADQIDEVGIVYSTDKVNSRWASNGEIISNSFDTKITGLAPKTTYYYQAFIKFNGKFYLSEIKSFETTEEEKLNIVVTTGATNEVTTTSANIIGNMVSGIDISKVEEVSIAYGTDSNVNSLATKGIINVEANAFENALTGLAPNTTYYYRAVVKVNGEYYYGEIKSFETEKETSPQEELGSWDKLYNYFKEIIQWIKNNVRKTR